MSEVRAGDLILITADHWRDCVLVVDEVRKWGVQAYLQFPRRMDPRPVGLSVVASVVLAEDAKAFLRVEHGDYVVVGRMPEDF